MLARPTVIRILESDKLLAASFALCLACACLPLAATPFLPLVDLGSNVGAASLLGDVVSSGSVSKYYEINTLPVPYLTAYFLIAAIELVTSSLTAAKCIVFLTIALLPLATIRLAFALRRSPRIGLLGFLFVWDVNMYWGWISFQLAMPLAMWMFAWLVESRDIRTSVRVGLLSVIVSLSHPHAVMWLLAGSFGLWSCEERLRIAWVRYAISLSGLLVLAPWAFRRALSATNTSALVVNSPRLEERVDRLFDYSLSVFTSGPAVVATALIFISLVALPAVLGAMDQREGTTRDSARVVSLVAATAALYFALPFEIGGSVPHWWTYPRFATYLLLLLPLVPRPNLGGRSALVLLPLGIAFVVSSCYRWISFAEYGEMTRPYLQIIASIPVGSRVAPLDIDFHYPGFRQATGGQLHGFLAAERSAYDPHLFDNASTPLLFRKDAPPFPDFHHPDTFDPHTIGRRYDYVVLHPASNRTLDRWLGNGLEFVQESGAWRLYRVTNPEPE